MSYLFFQLLQLFIGAKDKSDKQVLERAEMGGAISSVTSLAGVHGPSVGIAVGVSMGVLLCLAAVQFYQNRQLKKKIQQLIVLTISKPQSAMFAFDWSVLHRISLGDHIGIVIALKINEGYGELRES